MQIGKYETKNREERKRHAGHDQQKKREELMAKFPGLCSSDQKVAVDFCIMHPIIFLEVLHLDGSIIAKSPTIGLFHDGKCSFITESSY
jgi:hypothetical protein